MLGLLCCADTDASDSRRGDGFSCLRSTGHDHVVRRRSDGQQAFEAAQRGLAKAVAAAEKAGRPQAVGSSPRTLVLKQYPDREEHSQSRASPRPIRQCVCSQSRQVQSAIADKDVGALEIW